MHTTPGTIVVGVDGSEHADRAARWAAEQAAAEHRTVTLVHTVSAVTPTYLDAALADPRTARSRLQAGGEQVLDAAAAVVDAAAPGLEVRRVFELVDTRQGLLQLSEDAAMVVVGSRGRGPLRSLLLGSVSAALVRHASCPVTVVRPERGGTPRHGVVVGLDGSAESLPVLEHAYRQASLHAHRLTILHCRWDVAPGTATAYLVPDDLALADDEPEGLGLAEATAGMAEKYPDMRARARLGQGRAEDVLAHLSHSMDLVVVGTHHHGRGHRALVGSVSAAVVEHAWCPVTVVPMAGS
ncbi:universal stress protein [Nocardioides aurantiacus]|uniref:Nucleotide-binding universal stress UspA family protein n=1 Tax=Nocardioides aurantiacus TaxID=86796 RepID=A0A3N2CTW2_9ACTN|nr:universal stress protein [Nocardioides aurantiacus]ROR90848.1 nucleotide-binding universal stress UspA family protein [Nocardioides aurantiacus]